MSLQRWAGAAGIAVAVCAVCGHLPGPLDPTASPPSQSTAPTVDYTDVSGSIPPDPHFPCEDISYHPMLKCTPAQSKVLFDRNCAQSEAGGDSCGTAYEEDGTPYEYNIQSPEHAAEAKARGDQMSQKICAALTKDGGTCNVVASDP